MEIAVGDFKVRPVVAYDFVMFEHLNSPIHRQILETAQRLDEKKNPPEEVPFTKEDSWDLIWQLTRPVREADAVFQAGGAKAVHDAAKSIPFELDQAVINDLFLAALSQIKRYMDTMVKYGSSKEKGEGETVFFPQPEESLTASGGG